MPTARFLVSGRVQGVFFRASTQRHARELGLTGYARNLPDGRVEVVASGTDAVLADLEEWLWTGPSAARVEDVSREELPPQTLDGFTIR